jgi:DNA-binding response OmpR family regulator
MGEAKQKILIVEDDLDDSDMLNAYFNVQGYDVISVNWGEDGVRACFESPPDLVILDINLPDLDGCDVARKMRNNPKSSRVPIIFLTTPGNRIECLQELELPADDYFSKPYDIQELRLRVYNALRLSGQDKFSNPVTGLPDGSLVDDTLADCLRKIDWAMIRISVLNLDEFQKDYGLDAGNDVLRSVGLIMQNTARELGGQEDFLGHLGMVDLLLVTRLGRSQEIQEQIHARVESALDYFYPIKDRDRPSLQGRRLGVRVVYLRPTDGIFTTLDALKLALLGKTS